MKYFVVCLLALPAPWFDADCPVMMLGQIDIGGPSSVCMLGLADCTNGGTAPVMVFGNCDGDLCSCVDSACDCSTPDSPDGPNPDDGPDADPDSPDPMPPGSGENTDPSSPNPAAEETSDPPVLGQPLTFDGRILRPNQSLESKTIRIANAPQTDPSTDLIKVSKEVTVDRVTSVRFSPGALFAEEAFYGLFELKTVAPVKYTVNGMEFSIPAGKKFHIAIRLQNEPKELSNLGRSYRALARNNSQDSPQEGVITLDGVQYHAIGRK